MSWAVHEKSYSEGRACRLVALHARTFRRKSKRRDHGVLRTRLKALATEWHRFGYWRMLILLRRQGFVVNHKKLFPDLSRRIVDRQEARRTQAGHRNTSPLDVGRVLQRALIIGLRCRCLERWPPLPPSGCGRSLLARVRGVGAQNFALSLPCCSRAGWDHCAAWKVEGDRQ